MLVCVRPEKTDVTRTNKLNKSSKEAKGSHSQRVFSSQGKRKRTPRSLQNVGRISYQTLAEPGFLPVQGRW